MQREAGSSLVAALRRCWQTFASTGSSNTASSSSSGLAAALEDAMLWMGTRDPKTKRGKIFRGSNGKSRPKKAPVNPLMLPAQPRRIPIPYPPNWQPGSAAAALA